MTPLRYQLQPYKGVASRFHCPSCNHHSKCFVRYIDIQTGEHVASHVGRCGRQDKCGYHFKPGQYFNSAANEDWQGHASKPFKSNKNRYIPGKPLTLPKPVAVNQLPDADYFINPDYVNLTLTAYSQNNFVQYLIKQFGHTNASDMVKRYHIGTHGHWPGACVFWQYDAKGWVRTGKIMLYDKDTGKRVKQPFNHITWAHSLIAKQLKARGDEHSFELKQCLFGEHLLAADPDKPVAIVESEKTAVIASALIPQFIWLASGSLEGLNPAKCAVLQGRSVMLFPDVNAYTKWKVKAMELQIAMPGATIMVSTVLENVATDEDRKNGIDIGDVVGW